MSYTIDASELKRARRFARQTGKAVRTAQFRAVNAVARKARTAASKEIRSQVRLTAGYVRKNLKLERATLDRPVATIIASNAATPLHLYRPRQLMRRAAGAKGDPLRGIPAGKKQAGVSVAVKKTSRPRKMRKAFLVPLRKNRDTLGVFIRTGKARGDIEHLLGPSVKQVFDDVREQIRPTVRADLVREYKAQLRFAMSRVKS